jgi:hypothetical protein
VCYVLVSCSRLLRLHDLSKFLTRCITHDVQGKQSFGSAVVDKTQHILHDDLDENHEKGTVI